GLEFAGAVSEIGETDTRLAEFSAAMHQNRNLAHFVDIGAEFCRAQFSTCKEVNVDRFPISADQVEHQRDPIGIAGLGEAIELVFGRYGHCDLAAGWEPRYRWDLTRFAVAYGMLCYGSAACYGNASTQFKSRILVPKNLCKISNRSLRYSKVWAA